MNIIQQKPANLYFTVFITQEQNVQPVFWVPLISLTVSSYWKNIDAVVYESVSMTFLNYCPLRLRANLNYVSVISNRLFFILQWIVDRLSKQSNKFQLNTAPMHVIAVAPRLSEIALKSLKPRQKIQPTNFKFNLFQYFLSCIRWMWINQNGSRAREH